MGHPTFRATREVYLVEGADAVIQSDDVSLTREGGGPMVLRKGKVEIGNSGLMSAVRTRRGGWP